MNTEAPRLIPEMDAAAPTRAQRCVEWCPSVFLAAMCLFATCFFLWLIVAGTTYKEPNYSVAITAVSGLDPATDLGRRPAALNPEFNLAVVVAPRSPLIHACGEPGTAVRVSYHGFELASAAVPKFCEVEGTLTVVAPGDRMSLPAPALDSLAANMRRAAGVFDVAITVQHTESQRGATHLTHELVISCMGRHLVVDAGGAGAGAALCDVRTVE